MSSDVTDYTLHVHRLVLEGLREQGVTITPELFVSALREVIQATGRQIDLINQSKEVHNVSTMSGSDGE